MLVYNKSKLENTLLLDEAKKLQKGGFISTNDEWKIDSSLDVYKTQNNWFVRVLLFLLGILLFGSAFGFFGVIGIGWWDSISSIATILILFAAFGLIAFEVMIKRNQYFRNGQDDAFLFCSLSCLFIGLFILTHYSETILYIAMFIIGIISCIRYVDSISALLAAFSLPALVANLFLKAGSIGQSVLPFVLMIVATVIYFTYKSLKKNPKISFIYDKSLAFVYGFSLVLFYCAGNYLVVRQATEELLYKTFKPGEDLPFAWFFYAFTFAVPLCYIYFSLRLKNRILLWIGLLSLAFAVYSIRFYYHILPPEIAMIIGGVLLLAVSIFSILKLKNKTEGLMSEVDIFDQTQDDFLKVESVMAAQNFGTSADHSTPNAAETGGGEFGGGGASANF